jgi:NAD+ kinase
VTARARAKKTRATLAEAPRVAVLVKRSSYRTFVEERNDEHVKGLLAANDPTVRRMRRSHEDHVATLEEVKLALTDLGARFDVRDGPRTRIEGAYDLVVTVGGDGTLLAASHQIGPGLPLLGVNSAPESSVGFFCAASKGSARETIGLALSGALPGIVLARMRVELNGREIHNRVLNEALFCHASPAATSRYILSITAAAGRTPRLEEQKSSGLWIGPPAGSTAAQRSAGGRVLPLTSQKLQYVVREAYLAGGRSPKLAVGTVGDGGTIALRSKTRHAKLFLDGHHDEHDVAMGDTVEMRLSHEPLTVLGLRKPSRS